MQIKNKNAGVFFNWRSYIGLVIIKFAAGGDVNTGAVSGGLKILKSVEKKYPAVGKYHVC